MSIEAWVRPTAQGSWRTVVLKERPGDLVYALYAASRFENSNTWRPSAWIGADPVGAIAALTLNAWSHLATTYDGASWKFYVNGTLVASRAFAAPIGVSTGALRIGGNNIWPEWFKGQIDEVRIYSRALSAAEVVLDRDTPIAP
jgi:Concanavalin A-like lectin/glucanases superfamily